MFSINKLTQEISINRGDCAEFPIIINCGTELCPLQYTLKEHDKLYLAIEEPNQPFENAIVKKVLSRQTSLFDKDDNPIAQLKSNDTVALMPGLYYYEVKLKKYQENQFRNFYTIITLNDDNTYQIVNSQSAECLSNGTFSISNNLITFSPIDGVPFIGIFSFNEELNKEIITINNVNYEKEDDFICTVIPQTRFIIER